LATLPGGGQGLLVDVSCMLIASSYAGGTSTASQSQKSTLIDLIIIV